VSGSVVDVRAHGIPIEFLFVADCVISVTFDSSSVAREIRGLTYDSVWRMPGRLLLAYH
jgi:hypothetical protein